MFAISCLVLSIWKFRESILVWYVFKVLFNLICSFCKFVKFIDPNQILLEDTFISSVKNDNVFNTHLRTLDNTLPRTREYKCPNSKCASHKNPKLREAVIYRRRNTMHTSYMCCACNEFWNIS